MGRDIPGGDLPRFLAGNDGRDGDNCIGDAKLSAADAKFSGAAIGSGETGKVGEICMERPPGGDGGPRFIPPPPGEFRWGEMGE